MRGALPLAIGFAIAMLLQLAIGPFAGPFAVKLLMDVGINIILAVSLNLINGVTGQFSIGHAGFYAVGGYTSAFVVFYWGPAIRTATTFLPPMAQNGMLLLIGLFAAALAAGVAGLSVG